MSRSEESQDKESRLLPLPHPRRRPALTPKQQPLVARGLPISPGCGERLLMLFRKVEALVLFHVWRPDRTRRCRTADKTSEDHKRKHVWNDLNKLHRDIHDALHSNRDRVGQPE